jgi:hypothetical protein
LSGIQSLLDETWKVREGLLDALGNDGPLPSLFTHCNKITGHVGALWCQAWEAELAIAHLTMGNCSAEGNQMAAGAGKEPLLAATWCKGPTTVGHKLGIGF